MEGIKWILVLVKTNQWYIRKIFLKYDWRNFQNASATGKSLSEAIILRSTNPQYDKTLFIDLPVQYMKTTSSEHGEN